MIDNARENTFQLENDILLEGKESNNLMGNINANQCKYENKMEEIIKEITFLKGVTGITLHKMIFSVCIKPAEQIFG